jgi:hypothetical protein
MQAFSTASGIVGFFKQNMTPKRTPSKYTRPSDTKARLPFH